MLTGKLPRRRWNDNLGLTMIVVSAAFFVLPLFSILRTAFAVDHPLKAIAELAVSEDFTSTLRFTIREALVSAALSTLLAIPSAYILTRGDGLRVVRLSRNLVMLPFVLPGVLVVLSMIVFYGTNGFISNLYMRLTGADGGFTFLYGFWGIILVHVFYNLSLGIRFIGSSWERIDLRLAEAAQTLGAGRAATFRTVTLPLLAPSVVYSFLLAFIYSALSFTAVLVFGGGFLRTLEVLIYTEFNTMLNFAGASRLVLLQALAVAVLIAAGGWLSGRNRRISTAFTGSLENSRGRRMSGGRLTGIVLLILFSIGPLAALGIRSSQPKYEGGPFFPGYRDLIAGEQLGSLGVNAYQVVYTSFLYGIIVSVLCTALAYGVASVVVKTGGRAVQAVNTIMLLPVAISPVSYAIGLSGSLGDLVPPWVCIIVFQTFMAMPIVYPIVKVALDELNPRYAEASALLGASSKDQFFSIKLPLLRGSFASALAYGFAISIGDFSGVLLLGKGQVVTFSVAIYRLIGHYNFSQATALGSLLALVTIAAFTLIDRYTQTDEP